MALKENFSDEYSWCLGLVEMQIELDGTSVLQDQNYRRQYHDVYDI